MDGLKRLESKVMHKYATYVDTSRYLILYYFNNHNLIVKMSKFVGGA